MIGIYAPSQRIDHVRSWPDLSSRELLGKGGERRTKTNSDNFQTTFAVIPYRHASTGRAALQGSLEMSTRMHSSVYESIPVWR